MSDVRLFNTVDGGDIAVSNGQVEVDGGLETMAYLCLFGGNLDDDGAAQNLKSWWGNIGEADPYRSQFQYLLNKIPTTSANLQRLQRAAEADLAIFRTARIVSEITVEVSVPRLGWVRVIIELVAEGEEQSFEFTENWPNGA